jgi:glutamyl-tRNA reductase
MALFVVGINHKTAPIDVREKFYLNTTERELLLSTLQSNPSIVEAIVLSTCNRTEVYAQVISSGGLEAVLKPLFDIKKLSLSAKLRKHFYEYHGQNAIDHFFRVCTGLDSIVLGEKQILGQVKSAIDLSRKRGMMGRYFNVLYGLVIKAGKKSQSETQISYGGVSVSWAAVTMAKRIMGTLQDKSFLIIGAGKMGHLAASHLKNKKVGDIYVMNRSLEKAEALADKFAGMPVSFWDMKEVLQKIDVCICSVGAPHHILERNMLEKVMPSRKGKELLCIDISIPRNIEPSVSSLDSVSLITIDDLGDVVAENMEKRYSALSQVEDIIAKKIGQYNSKISKIHDYETAGVHASGMV